MGGDLQTADVGQVASVTEAFQGAGQGLPANPISGREQFILNEEGFFLRPKDDSKGVLTLGPGLNLEEESIRSQIPEEVLAGKRDFTMEEALPIFRQRMVIAKEDLVEFVGEHALSKLNDDQMTSMLSLSYNLGINKLWKFEKLQRALIFGLEDTAADEAFGVGKSDRQGQLKARSEREFNLFAGQ